jgi:hypothetical protein
MIDLKELEALLDGERDAYAAIVCKPRQVADGVEAYLDRARHLNGVLRVAAPALIAELTERRAAAERDAARIAELEGALTGVVDDEPCWYDHHGYCQAHFVTSPCEMAEARAALAGPSDE